MRPTPRRKGILGATHGAIVAALIALVLHAAPGIAADAAKTLRIAFSGPEQSFDPQFSADAASDGVIDHIFDAMLDYDYLARPMTLVPRTLVAMPTVTDNGATYVFKLKPGTFFTPDPAFKGKPRELTAGDYAYAVRRLLDPAVKSPWLWLVEGKIIGGDELRAQAIKSGKFDYDAPIPGLEVVDRYTLRVRLNRPDLRFLYVFAVPNTAAVAREVVEAHGQDFGAHPIGTGPYILGEYKRSTKMVLVANPGLSRHDVCAGRSGAAGIAADRGRAQGPEIAADRAHPDHGHRRRPVAVARVFQPRTGHARPVARRVRRAGA